MASTEVTTGIIDARVVEATSRLDGQEVNKILSLSNRGDGENLLLDVIGSLRTAASNEIDPAHERQVAEEIEIVVVLRETVVRA